MMPIKFPESNCCFDPPASLDESQVKTIHAWRGIIDGGNLDGLECVVVAWQPNANEIKMISEGQPIFINIIGGLVPHALSMDFKGESQS